MANRVKEDEKHERIIRGLLKRPENRRCINCNSLLCAGLKYMHRLNPPYAHNDLKPSNVLLTHRKGQPPLAILMDFGSALPARKQIRSRAEALQLQEWASEHCTAPFRAPELWDCPSHADIDERTDIWSLGCTLYAIINAGKGKMSCRSKSKLYFSILLASMDCCNSEFVRPWIVVTHSLCV